MTTVLVNNKCFKPIMKSILKHNKVTFEYEKEDGTLRKAIGTCNVVDIE
jgi:hypothetical protein